MNEMNNKQEFQLPITIGKDMDGNEVSFDLSKAPHILIAGETGSGKSVCIHNIIISLLQAKTPEEIKLILLDPKMVELDCYDVLSETYLNSSITGHEVIADLEEGLCTVKNLADEVDRRYQMFYETKTRNIEQYNNKFPEAKLPYIVFIIDEYGDYGMVFGNKFLSKLARIANVSRLTGIYTVISTQRPSPDIVTAFIKANYSTRISFKLRSVKDSIYVLDERGAEELNAPGEAFIKGIHPWENSTRIKCNYLDYDDIIAKLNALSN